jgi:hypothetical protein
MPSIQDLKKLRKLVALLILWIIFRSDNFKNKDALLNYIDTCKLEQYILNVHSGTIN